MKWIRCGTDYVIDDDCERVILSCERGQWWVRFHPDIAPNGITVQPADTLRQAKAIAEGVLGHADTRTGLREALHQRLSDGERYRAALQAIRTRCEASESVDSAGLMWLVDEALR